MLCSLDRLFFQLFCYFPRLKFLHSSIHFLVLRSQREIKRSILLTQGEKNQFEAKDHRWRISKVNSHHKGGEGGNEAAGCDGINTQSAQECLLVESSPYLKVVLFYHIPCVPRIQPPYYFFY